MSNERDVPRSVAIRTAFAHHAANSGYKRILEYTKPSDVLGVDEVAGTAVPRLARKYRFAAEFTAYRRHQVSSFDLIHVLYGEEYFRFSKRLFPKTPVVATFHQPPEVLEREIEHGDPMGRAYRIAHLLNRNRFEQLDAAIVITEAQKAVLSKVMDPSRIYVIPLGCDSAPLIAQANEVHPPANYSEILTVGNWLRDWDAYFEFVEFCRRARPDWTFRLINRKLSEACQLKARGLSNLIYQSYASDIELVRAYRRAAVQFLPFKEATGNNSLNEGLACGCPVVTNISVNLPQSEQFSKTVPLDFEQLLVAIEPWIGESYADRDERVAFAQAAAQSMDWATVGEKTLAVFRDAILNNKNKIK